ncbi:MAG: SpoIIIAH-like family protein [Clostridia bacterium]|nr:SpoIIIAH-like family protein [Clostridia bacterium]
MKIGKRQLILTGLVLALGTAVYLNWQFSANSDLLQGADTVSVSKELGQAEFVNTSVSQKSNTKEESTQKSTQKSTDKATQPTENIAQTSNMIPEPTTSAKTEENTTEQQTQQSTEKKSSDEYFAQAKLNRKQTQDKILEMAKDVLKAVESDENAKAQAIQQATELALLMEQQANIENLINAKGFPESMAFIQNNQCSVIVKDDELTSEEAMIIKDIVTTQSKVTADKVKIVAVG